MLKKILISLAIMFALPTLAHAEITAADHQAIDAKVDKFFASWNEKKVTEGYEAFMLPLVSDNPQMLRNLIVVTEQVVAFFDKPFEYEKVAENTLGDRVVYRQYLLYNDKAPYLVKIVMFRTSAGWAAQSVFMGDLTVDAAAQ